MAGAAFCREMKCRARAVVSYVYNTEEVYLENLKDAVAILCACLLGWWEGLASGYTACKEDIVNKEVKRDAQVVERGSELEEPPHTITDQGFAGMPWQQNEHLSEENSMREWEMSSQRAAILENYFEGSLKVY